jgi:hypothetical protein
MKNREVIEELECADQSFNVYIYEQEEGDRRALNLMGWGVNSTCVDHIACDEIQPLTVAQVIANLKTRDGNDDFVIGKRYRESLLVDLDLTDCVDINY